MSKKKDRDIAKEMYLESNGKMPLVDIARELKKSPGTIRGWKSRYKWDEEIEVVDTVTLQKKRNVAKKECNVTEKKEMETEDKIIKEVAKNKDLNDKQQLFCIYYLKYFNATKAYQKAYGCSYITANTNGPALLVNTSIKAEIERLKDERLTDIYLDSKDILQQYIDIAFSDITDYVEFGVEEREILDSFGMPVKDEEGNVVKGKFNYVRFKDHEEVDGTLISEVSHGKNGVKVRLQDKMKALDWLSNNLPKYQDKDLDKELLETKIEKEKAAIDKIRKDIDADIDKPIEIQVISKSNR